MTKPEEGIPDIKQMKKPVNRKYNERCIQFGFSKC
jgi:hypothetical protein